MEKKTKRPSPYGAVKFRTIDEYHAAYDGRHREMLDSLRQIIRSTIPESTELISYNMPAFRQNKNLVYYGAAKNHVGFYPSAAPVEKFKEDLTEYQTSKGAIQFPYDKELPVELIQKIVRFAAEEDMRKNKISKSKA